MANGLGCCSKGEERKTYSNLRKRFLIRFLSLNPALSLGFLSQTQTLFLSSKCPNQWFGRHGCMICKVEVKELMNRRWMLGLWQLMQCLEVLVCEGLFECLCVSVWICSRLFVLIDIVDVLCLLCCTKKFGVDICWFRCVKVLCLQVLLPGFVIK